MLINLDFSFATVSYSNDKCPNFDDVLSSYSPLLNNKTTKFVITEASLAILSKHAFILLYFTTDE